MKSVVVFALQLFAFTVLSTAFVTLIVTLMMGAL